MDVQFVFDVPCVWSYLAYARFQRAAARIRAEGGEVTVRFRPFQLDPRATVDGEPKIDVLRRAFGAEADDAVAGIESKALSEGLTFCHRHAVWSDTLPAHRLIAVAARQGRGEAMVERLFRAHHTDELNIADQATLRRLADEVGVAWRDGGDDDVRAELARVRAEGVRAVPVFRLAGRTPHGALSEQTLYQEMSAPVAA
ncbi:DsbA family protein [Micromonospora sp. C31]|uniref:DsbA family protein n=1 Tax=Micromonospora sp. C31 TaxID=2824876 RepID=UPI001B37E5DB|nr:DsbA family protein [Micromonospora sp. C31]MBQ1074037.1 DsbA family protein [Micromonospora sp. C31]